MNVLSLFDGMSCARIALKELGIKVDKYFASEIDKYAIAQTRLNFPDTIQLGDVTQVDGYALPKIDLLVGGSPCQGFSFAGKQLNFKDPRSKLLFEYVRILKELRAKNPNIKFMLENVRMRKEYEMVITNELGLFPVCINSSLVSAQNRIRLYWTNIRTRTEGLFSEVYTDIPQPKDKGLLLKDILETEVDTKYYLSEKVINNMLQRPRGENKGGFIEGKAPTLTANAWEQTNLVVERNGVRQLNQSKESAGQQPYQQNRIYDTEGKSPALMHGHAGNTINVFGGGKIRRLTPLECSRLQTIPSWYVWQCSETQTYKMLGNGWTVEVIKHIFSYLKQ